MTAVQFLNCIRRFVSRSDLVISDNAPQFKLVNTTLNKQWRQVLSDKEVLNYIAVEGIKWMYTTPWQGGFYERLVSMINHFCFEQLITLLTEIEAVLNSRPLTYVYEDFDSGFTLTPAHFLVANRKLGLSSGNDDIDYNKNVDYQPSKDSATKLLETWRKGQVYLNMFWRIWKDEYLISLREKISLYHRGSNESQRLPKATKDRRCCTCEG